MAKMKRPNLGDVVHYFSPVVEVETLEVAQNTDYFGGIVHAQAEHAPMSYLGPLDEEEQKVYQETAREVENGNFTQAFASSAVQLHRIQKTQEQKFGEILSIQKTQDQKFAEILDRLPPKP